MPQLSSEDSPEAHGAARLTILLAVGWVVIAVGADVTLLTALGMLVGGLLLQGASNVLASAVLNPALQGESWALAIMSLLRPLVVVGMSLYLAGPVTLVVQGSRAMLSW